MSRRKKISIEERVKIIRKNISGGIGITEAGRVCGVNSTTVADWVRNYEVEGVEAFLPHHNHKYSPEEKAQAVNDYLCGKGSLRDISKKYGIRDTNRTFHAKLEAAGMTQSMSRVAHCIDNGPMEGFWGILKRERYYSRRFTGKEELMDMIHNYIAYYNNRRVQRNLGVLTPTEKHEQYFMAA